MSVAIPTQCAKCGNACWDNRAKKASGDFKPTSPDFSCKDKGCGWAFWLTPKGAAGTGPRTTPAPVQQESGVWHDAKRLYQTCFDNAVAWTQQAGGRPSPTELALIADSFVKIALKQGLPAVSHLRTDRPPAAPPKPVDRGALAEVEDDFGGFDEVRPPAPEQDALPF